MLARTLRNFGLVDSFGLSQLVESGCFLSLGKIERLIREGEILLPTGTTPRSLAERLASDLKIDPQDADSELRALIASMSSIPPGRNSAGRYHASILKILRLLFEDRLGRIQKEKPIFSGMKRVDLKADNDQPAGFFANLHGRLNLFCPYVFFECKNYVADIKNPDFDQLFTRLGTSSTQVGVIVCRQIDDAEKALQRVKQPFGSERKLVLLLTDSLLAKLAETRINQGLIELDDRLNRELERVIL